MQGTICSSNMDSERLRMELPLHNWLEHKLRQESIRKESIRSFEDEVVSDSDSQNFVFKKKSKHVTMKDKPCVVKNKDINIKHLESKTKSSEVITSNVESDKTKDLAPKDFVLKDLSPEGLAPKDLAPEDLATKTKSNDDAVKVSCEVKDSLDCNRNRMTDISHRNNYQNEKASAYIKTDSGTIADSNNWSNTFIEVDLTTDDEQPLVINESSNSDSKQTNLSPLSVQQEKESAQNMDLPDVLIIDEMSSIKAEIPCSKFKISDTKRVLQANTKQSKNNTESLRSTDVQPGLNDLKTNGNLTSEQPADSQPLNLSVRKSVDITSKPQKPLPKIQLVHPQIVSSKTMKTAEETGIIQSTKMLLNSVESTDTSNQGVPYSSDTVNETVYDLSNNAHSNNTENRENFTNETCMGLLESTHSAAGVSSNSVLREDVEFQKQVNELKQLEYLARKKEKEHAQVLALSRMKLESIMKLKLEKKRAAALNLSSASEAARSTLHDTALASRSTLHDTALASISATKSSSLICPEKTMAEKNKDVTEERPTADRIIKTEIMEQEIIKTEKMEDSDQSDRNNTSSTCTEDRAGTCTEDRASTCTEDQAGESTTQTNVSEYKKITNEIHQAMQAHKKTFKNPKQDSRTLQSPLPAHQSERQLIPEVDPCRLPVDASTVSPRLRTTELPDPFVKAQHNIHKAPIQLAHCQPAFQSAGSLIVPNVQNIQNADLPPFNNNCSKSKVKKSYKTRESGHQNVEPTDLQNKSLPRSEKRKINLSDSFTDQELPRKSPPPLKKAKTRGNISTEIASSNRRLHVLKNPFDDSHTQRQRVEHNSLNQAGLILPHTSASHLNQDHYQFQQNQMNYPPRSIHQQQLIRPALTAFSGAQGVRHPFYDKSSQMSTQSVKSPQPVYPNRPALPVEHNYPGMRQIGREQMNRQMQQMRYQVPSPPMNHARAVPPLHGNLEPGEIVTNHFRPGQYSSLANSLKDQPNTDNRLFHMQHQLGMNNLRMIRHVLPQHMVRHPVIPENHRQSSFEQNALINRGFQQLRPIAPQPHHSNPVFSSQEDSNRYHLAQMAQHREHEQYSKKNLQQKPMSHSSYSAVKAPNMTVTPPQKCSVCGKPSAFVCSRCRQSWYCNEACQNTHWKIHSQSCRDS